MKAPVKNHSTLVALCVFSSTAAVAATIPFTEALVSASQFDGPTNIFQTDLHTSPVIPATETFDASGPWGSLNTFASANLATGELKVRAADRPIVDVHPSVQTNAFFGDGFHARTPSGPFAWLPGSTAQFSLDVSGTFVASQAVNNLNAGAFVVLAIYQPGTLDPNQKLIGGANGIEYFLYRLGNTVQRLFYTDPAGMSQELVATASFPDVSSPIHIDQPFRPGGDFDWLILLGASGQVGIPDFFDADFSHTVNVSYAGPQGTTTTTESGLFNHFTTPVPEPSAIALLGLGSALLVRRNRARDHAGRNVR